MTDVGGPESLAAADPSVRSWRRAARTWSSATFSMRSRRPPTSRPPPGASWARPTTGWGKRTGRARAAGAGLYDAAHASELTASDAADIAKALNAVGRFGHVPRLARTVLGRRARRRPPAGAGRSGDGTGPRGRSRHRPAQRRRAYPRRTGSDRPETNSTWRSPWLPTTSSSSSTPHGWPWRPVSPSEPRASSRVPRHGPSEGVSSRRWPSSNGERDGSTPRSSGCSRSPHSTVPTRSTAVHADPA